MIHLTKAVNNQFKKVQKDLEQWAPGDVWDLADELYSNSDEPDDVSGWNDVKNDLDNDDAIAAIGEYFDDHGLNYRDFIEMQK